MVVIVNKMVHTERARLNGSRTVLSVMLRTRVALLTAVGDGSRFHTCLTTKTKTTPSVQATTKKAKGTKPTSRFDDALLKTL